MPRTKQPVADRIGRKMTRLRKDTDKIMDESPKSETKAQMKKRLAVRSRVTLGDDPGDYWKNKPSDNPMRRGGKVKSKKGCK